MIGRLSVNNSEQDERGSSRFRKCRQVDRKERNVRQTPGKDERRSIRYVVAVCAVADVNGDNGPPRFPRQRLLGRRNSQSKNLFLKFLIKLMEREDI